MIERIQGRVLAVEPDGVVILVAGFGVKVHVPAVSAKEGEELTLATYLAVKQDGLELYGFEDPLDLAFFKKCMTVSGVGVKTALSFLKRSPREPLETAIAKRDVTYLTRVVGLGKKAAEKLVVELSEKMSAATTETSGDDADIFDTLVALGYTEREARGALQNIDSAIIGKDARLRAALAAK